MNSGHLWLEHIHTTALATNSTVKMFSMRQKYKKVKAGSRRELNPGHLWLEPLVAAGYATEPYMQRIMRAGGCLVVVAQWWLELASYPGSSLHW